MSARPSRWIALAVIGATTALGVWLVSRPARSSSAREWWVMFRPSGTVTEQEFERAMDAIKGGLERRGGPLPPGVCLLRCPSTMGRWTWDGRREWELSVEACPGELESARLYQDGSPVAGVENRQSVGRDKTSFTFHGPLFGHARMRLEWRTVAGELEPYEFRLPGTLYVDVDRTGAWLRRLVRGR